MIPRELAERLARLWPDRFWIQRDGVLTFILIVGTTLHMKVDNSEIQAYAAAWMLENVLPRDTDVDYSPMPRSIPTHTYYVRVNTRSFCCIRATNPNRSTAILLAGCEWQERQKGQNNE